MTTEFDPLLLGFADDRPRELAALLVAAQPEEMIGLIERLPPAVAAGLMACLPTRQVSRLLQLLDPELAATALGAARHEDAIALISQLPDSHKYLILDVGSKRQRRLLHHLYDSRSRTLAALATADFIRAHGETRCRDFRAELEAHDSLQPLPIYVVDDRSVYLGELNPLSALDKRTQNHRLRSVISRIPPLSGRMSIAAALKVEEWQRHPQLPVVDENEHLLGVIDHHGLRRQLSEHEPEEEGLERSLRQVVRSFFDFSDFCLRALLSGRETPR